MRKQAEAEMNAKHYSSEVFICVQEHVRTCWTALFHFSGPAL